MDCSPGLRVVFPPVCHRLSSLSSKHKKKNPKCLYLSDRKLAGASAIAPALSLSLLTRHFHSAAKSPREPAVKQTMGTDRPSVTGIPTAVHAASSWSV